MAATMYKIREKTGAWSTTFPQKIDTVQKSANFTKKLLAVAISNITYLRAMFPEKAYSDRCLEDLNLKILKEGDASPGANQVIKWIKGIFDSIDRKYLRVLTIGIYTNPDDPETIIESYLFKFSYADETSIEITRNGKHLAKTLGGDDKDLKKATIKLLRTIVIVTQNLNTLPDDALMTMKLLYYDDVTPEDYEPPNFKATDVSEFTFLEDPINLKVGDVETPFHSVKLRIRTAKDQFNLENEDPSKEMASNQDETKNSKNTDKCYVLDGGLDYSSSPNNMPLPGNSPSISKKHQESKKNDVQVVPEPTSTSPIDTNVEAVNMGDDISMKENAQVRCPCGYNEDDGLMIQCEKCHGWQHGVCFKIIDDYRLPSSHFCEKCSNIEDHTCQPTDPDLCGLSETKVESICLWRKALMACTEGRNILAPRLAKRISVEHSIAQGLVNRLLKEGFLKRAARKKLGYQVDRDALREGITKYFSKTTCSPPSVEMENLTNRTDNIQLDGPVQKDVQMIEKDADTTVCKELRSGRKRVRAKTDESVELDLSQEMSKEYPGRKRRKASTVVKGLTLD